MNDVIILPVESEVILMALTNLIENMTDMLSDSRFNVEARTISKDIIEKAKSAESKIKLISGSKFKMEAYKPGDEKDFINPHIKNPLA